MHNAMKPPSYSYHSKWNKKKVQDSKEFYERSRFLWSNHYDPGVHKQPWISPGKQVDPHWVYDDSGLIPDQYKDNLWENKQLAEQEIDQKLQKMRKFKEYELIYEDEYLVTIEYCSHCSYHKTSTRHDEAKYQRQANKVKRTILQNFPNCQVLLKPLLIQPHNKDIQNRYLQKRLGCCEVQLCHKKRGQGSHSINYTLFKLHSKLESKTWPKPRKIVEKMQKQMPKFVFYVQVQSQGGQDQMDELEIYSDGENDEYSKLQGLKITLVPYRDSELAQCQNDDHAMTNMSMSRSKLRIRTAKGPRPVSGKLRPISAYSNISNRPMSGYNRRPQTSQVPVKKSRPMTGMSQKSRRGKKQKKKKVKTIKETTDERGIAIFENVSLDIYVVKVSANQNFMNESQVVNLFELHEQSGKHNMTTTIRLRSQAMAFCHIKLVGQVIDNDPKTKDNYTYDEKITNADVQLYLDTSEENEDRATVVKEKIHVPGDYSVVLEPGFYWCVVSKHGYGKIKERITLKKGENNIQIRLQRQDVPEQQEGMEGVVGLQLFDAFNKEPIVGATVTLKNTKKKTVITEQSGKDGTCKIVTDPIRFGMLSIVKEGYLLIKEEIDPSHLTFSQLQNIAFPMIRKPEGENDVRVVFFSQDETRKLDIYVIDPEGKHNTTHNHSQGGVDNGTSVISLKDVSKKQGIYRFYAKIHQKELLQHESIKIFYFNCDTVQVIESPCVQHKSHLVYWDLGFINCPDDHFIKINAFTKQQISKELYLRQYQQLCQQLINSTIKNSQFSLDKLLGFTHKDAIVEGNDRFVSKIKIQNSLEKYGFDCDNDFLDHLLYSGCTSRGVYSFQKLKLKFKKAMEAVQQQLFVIPLENEEEEEDQQLYDEDDENLFNDDVI